MRVCLTTIKKEERGVNATGWLSKKKKRKKNEDISSLVCGFSVFFFFFAYS